MEHGILTGKAKEQMVFPHLPGGIDLAEKRNPRQENKAEKLNWKQNLVLYLHDLTYMIVTIFIVFLLVGKVQSFYHLFIMDLLALNFQPMQLLQTF